MRGKNRAARERRVEASTAQRLEEIVEAAERAAETVIDDAEAEARRYLAEKQAEADRVVAERLDSLARLTDSLVEQAEAIRLHSEHLLAELERARGSGEDPQPVVPAQRKHLSAVEPLAERRPDEEPQPEFDNPAGARLLATQMAVAGSSREEIAARLRSRFEIEDTSAILDAILGPED